jgi:hypothetical protein
MMPCGRSSSARRCSIRSATGVELLVAQPLVEQRLRRSTSLRAGVVGADQQVADDGLLRVAQRRDRDDRGKRLPSLRK